MANNNWPNKRTTYYSQSNEPWDPESLPKCPPGSSPDPVNGHLTFDQGRIDAVKYPNVGATCKAQVMAQEEPKEETKTADSPKENPDKQDLDANEGPETTCPENAHGW